MTRYFRYDVPLETLPVFYQRIYEALYEAAYLGKPCPTNRALAIVSGFPDATPRYATEAVLAIEAAGLIKVHRGHRERIVILPSGQATFGSLETFVARKPVQPPIAPLTPRTARTSCTYCGTNSEHGCVHSRRVA